MTKTRWYRTRQEFIYPPTGFLYAVGIVDQLNDWHPDDIKEALRNLIEVAEAPVATTSLAGPLGGSQPKEEAVGSKE